PRQADVAHDGHQPSFLTTTLEGGKRLVSPEERVLNRVLRVFLVAHQPAGKIVCRIEMRQHPLLEMLTRPLVEQGLFRSTWRYFEDSAAGDVIPRCALSSSRKIQRVAMTLIAAPNSRDRAFLTVKLCLEFVTHRYCLG